MTITNTLFAVVASAAILVPTLAEAAETTVSYKAYELASPAGRATVIDRIERRSRQACMSEQFFMRRDCTKQLTAEFVSKINNAQLTTQWRGKGEQLAAR